MAHLRGRRKAMDWMLHARRVDDPLAVSAVSWSKSPMECGRRNGAQSVGSSLGNYLVAAAAETEGCELATLNARHYPMLQGLSSLSCCDVSLLCNAEPLRNLSSRKQVRKTLLIANRHHIRSQPLTSGNGSSTTLSRAEDPL